MEVEKLQAYLALGWPLFPCSARTKAPLTPHGFKDASTDWQRVEAWDKAYPGCAWGTPTSAERGVIDIDPRHGGDETLARLEAEHGPIPPTPKVRTGGGGFHFYLRFPPGTKCGVVAEGIDRKAEGGYVIVPPSRIDIAEHQGRAYAWEVRPWETALAEAPAWCMAVAPVASAGAPAQAANPWIVQAAGDDLFTHPGCQEGERNGTCVRLVGIHFARGDSEASIRRMVAAWAERCQPPLAESEWQKHVDGLVRKEQAKALKTTTPSAPTPYKTSVSVEEDRSDTLAVRKEVINSQADGDSRVNYLLTSSPGDGDNGQAGLITSFPPSGNRDGGEAVLSAAWPTLPPEAYHGLFGEMLKAITPETEADPAAVLLGWFTCFGNIVGRGAWAEVGPRLHHPALYLGVASYSGEGKADAWAASLWPFKQAEPEWAVQCVCNGVGSGEGLIERVEDLRVDGDGKAVGATDKRCLLRLSELSGCFKRGRRENATLSEHLREAWDGEPIHVPNRKGNALSASGYAVSVYGDITFGVIRKLLECGTEAFDGFANRFLWCVMRSETDLSEGGSTAVLTPFLDRLAEALAFAKQAGRMERDAEAKALWERIYPALKRSARSVPHTDRARAYAQRLSMLYALADCSKVIRREHLQAALALWDYCRASARLLFGNAASNATPQGRPDDLWLDVLNVIAKAPGVKRGDLTTAFKNRAKADEMDAALTRLERNGLAHPRTVQAEGGGRPAECWHPGPKPDGDGESDGDEVDNPRPSPPNRLGLLLPPTAPVRK